MTRFECDPVLNGYDQEITHAPQPTELTSESHEIEPDILMPREETRVPPPYIDKVEVYTGKPSWKPHDEQ